MYINFDNKLRDCCFGGGKLLEYIKGTLQEIYGDSIVVENYGIAYRIYISVQDLNLLPQTGDQVKIYIHMNIKEDNITLYGFMKIQDRAIYRYLVSVTGVGPKLAMGILSVCSTKEIISSIINNDIVTLTKAPGIGKKTAQRIILELKDKLKSNDELIELEDIVSLQGVELKDEAIQALIALGYQPTLARKAINAIFKEGIGMESLIKKALQLLSNS